MHLASSKKKILYYPIIVWGIAALFYFFEFFLQVSPNVMTQELMQSFNITATKLGYLGGIYFISYAAMQIPVGLLLDSIGPRRILMVATTIAAIGCLLFGAASNYSHALLGRLFIGLGSSFAVVSCFKLISNWFPIKRFALLAGLTVTIGTLGAAMSQTIITYMLTLFTWRFCMIVFAVGCGVIACLIALFVYDRPKINPEHEIAHHVNSYSDLWLGLLNILKKKQSWYIAIYGALMFAPTTVFGGLWGKSFLEKAYHLSAQEAASCVSLLFVGWIVGSPVFGMMSDHFERRKLPMYIGSVGSLICIVGILYMNLPSWSVGAALFGTGFFSSGFFTSFSIVREINDEKTNATALGFMNAMNMVGPALFQPLVGFILDRTWDGKMTNGIPVYLLSDYRFALTILPVCILVSLVFLPLIRETYCKVVKS